MYVCMLHDKSRKGHVDLVTVQPKLNGDSKDEHEPQLYGCSSYLDAYLISPA